MSNLIERLRGKKKDVIYRALPTAETVVSQFREANELEKEAAAEIERLSAALAQAKRMLEGEHSAHMDCHAKLEQAEARAGKDAQRHLDLIRRLYLAACCGDCPEHRAAPCQQRCLGELHDQFHALGKP